MQSHDRSSFFLQVFLTGMFVMDKLLKIQSYYRFKITPNLTSSAHPTYLNLRGKANPNLVSLLAIILILILSLVSPTLLTSVFDSCNVEDCHLLQIINFFNYLTHSLFHITNLEWKNSIVYTVGLILHRPNGKILSTFVFVFFILTMERQLSKIWTPSCSFCFGWNFKHESTYVMIFFINFFAIYLTYFFSFFLFLWFLDWLSTEFF